MGTEYGEVAEARPEKDAARREELKRAEAEAEDDLPLAVLHQAKAV